MDGIKHTKRKKIANKFGEFYSQLGSNLAKSIFPGTTCIDQYVNNIPRHVDSMLIKPTTVHEIDRIIKNLPNKTSHGHDEISNIMPKALCPSIIFPLCLIFNQSLYEGKFPEMMKWAEVIPLYKGKSMDLMVNYRPISLLIMLSKILEKIMYKRLYSSMPANMDFIQRDLVSRLLLNLWDICHASERPPAFQSTGPTFPPVWME